MDKNELDEIIKKYRLDCKSKSKKQQVEELNKHFEILKDLI